MLGALVVDVVSWYHLLAAANGLLLLAGIVAFVAASRKYVEPAASPYVVRGTYIEPCGHFAFFAEDWKRRWRTSPPEYFVSYA